MWDEVGAGLPPMKVTKFLQLQASHHDSWTTQQAWALPSHWLNHASIYEFIEVPSPETLSTLGPLYMPTNPSDIHCPIILSLSILTSSGIKDIDLGTAKIFSGGREGHSCLAKVRVPCLLYQGYFLMQNLQRWEISPTLPSTWQPANKLAMLIIVNGEPQHFSRIWLRILPLVGEDDPTCCQIFSWKIGHFWIRFLKWSNSVYMIIRVRAYRLFRVV